MRSAKSLREVAKSLRSVAKSLREVAKSLRSDFATSRSDFALASQLRATHRNFAKRNFATSQLRVTYDQRCNVGPSRPSYVVAIHTCNTRGQVESAHPLHPWDATNGVMVKVSVMVRVSVSVSVSVSVRSIVRVS